MKAEVQYNDYIGTAAADISDFLSLNDFIKRRGVDIERYNAIGADFYSGYSDYITASIICIDNERSKNGANFLVSINFQNEITRDEFFDLFKRFNVVITDRYGSYEEFEIKEQMNFDDREEEKDE